MAHAIDRDALHARLVKAVDAWAKGCEATVRPLTARLIARLKNSKATTPISKIVDDEMRKLGIDATLRKSMRELVIDAVAHGYGILPTMMADRDKVGDKLMTTPWSGDDMTLSERLHQNAAYMRSVVSDAIQTARRQGQTFTQAARVLYDGYNSGQRVINAAKLPQYMQNVEQAARHVLSGGDLRDFQREMRRAQRAVDRLAKGGAPNKALKSAYQQMLNAAEAGSRKHLERAIRTAVEERSRYHAERIARTEAARAYFDGFIARNANDDDVIGYKWTIGGRHPKTDICDDHAAQDAHGLGAGVYPKDKLPEYPAHPHCLCHLSEVYADEVPGYKRTVAKVAAGAPASRVEAGEIEKLEAETAKPQALEPDESLKSVAPLKSEQRDINDRRNKDIRYDGRTPLKKSEVGKLEAQMKELMKRDDVKPLTLVDKEIIPRVLENGRLKSQFETGKSGGALGGERPYVEYCNMGYSLNHDPKMRPIYGMVVQSKDGTDILSQAQAMGDWYGDAAIVYKQELKRYMTVTGEDSLDYSSRIYPTPLLAPRTPSIMPLKTLDAHGDISRGGELTIDKLRDTNYIEIQIHGGHATLDNIEEIIYPKSTLDTDIPIDKLKELGIKWRRE